MKTQRESNGRTHREKSLRLREQQERENPVRGLPPAATGCQFSCWKSRIGRIPLNDSTSRVLMAT